MSKLSVIAISSLLLTACASVPVDQMNDRDLCLGYKYWGHQVSLEEIRRRGIPDYVCNQYYQENQNLISNGLQMMQGK